MIDVFELMQSRLSFDSVIQLIKYMFGGIYCPDTSLASSLSIITTTICLDMENLLPS